MATETRPWTRADLARLPDDGNRYEVLDGALFVTPSPLPAHQFVAYNLAVALGEYCRAHGLGVAVAPCALVFADNELQPDAAVFPRGPAGREEKWEELPRPRLVIEVLSGSTARRDHGVKREAYLRLGIPEYWIVDMKARRATTWTQGARAPVEQNGVLRWQPDSGIPALEIGLDSILPPAG